MRRLVSLGVLAAFVATLMAALMRLPAFGAPLSPLAGLYAADAVHDLHVTNVISAISYGYRGFDTMIEEFIFFACITSVSIILRNTLESNDEEEAASKGERVVERSDAINLVGVLWIGLTVALSLSMILHGQLTPGGGFQGGAILGTALLTVFLVTNRRAFERISPDGLVKIADSAGAGLFVGVGFCGLLFGGAFMANFLPLGKPKALLSGGSLWLVNIATAIEVSAGYALLFKEYLREVFNADSGDEKESAKG